MNKPPARILVVDDEPLLREYLTEWLGRDGYDVVTAADADEAMERIQEDQFDLALLDIRLKGGDGLGLLPEMRRLAPETPIVMMTGHGTVESAVKAMRLGAFDYLTKPFAAEAISVVLERALSVGALWRENADLKGRLSLYDALQAMIGRSRCLEELRATIRLVAPSRSTVLVQGESGVGKELVARAIHEGSPRREGPFVKINCAAVPAGLLESELFGHEKGAFTGASALVRGKFEQAGEGTLLLDEIGEMDLALQPKLLRALQEREFYRVGGSDSLRVDVRVVATTNADLRGRVRDGSFREDLYYRLNVMPVRVPPLRERRDDVPLLARHFLAQFLPDTGRREIRFTRPVIEALLRHSWPGNVRELMNSIERAVILCPGGELRLEHLLLDCESDAHDAATADSWMTGETMAEVEKAWILKLLADEAGNRTRAARRLGISVRTIRNKLTQYREESGLKIVELEEDTPAPMLRAA